MAFRECFGGVSRMVWWRFEGLLMAFRGCFDDVSRCDNPDKGQGVFCVEDWGR